MGSYHILLNFFLSFHIILNVWCCQSCPFSVKKDPDEDRDVPAIIESRGFKVEIHYVTTDDGYISANHRIVNPSLKSNNKRPVILQHGFPCSGADWIMGSPGIGLNTDETVPNNLGFALSILGYDVWLTNSRGNVYATNHTTLNPETDKEFWQFSFDEMIKYDLPAVIEYIQKATNKSKIAYVGHSQGSLIMFGLLSEFPEYSSVIEPFIALAPVARVANTKSPIRYFAENPLVVEYLYFKGGSFLPPDGFIDIILDRICAEAIVRDVCSNLLFLVTGFDASNLNKTRLPVYMAHDPAGTSSWNFIHYVQNVISKEFRKFDFGEEKNEQKYGTKSPPVYNLERITSKQIAILHSDNDWLADPKDVDYLRSQIKDNLMFDHRIPVKDWNHMDFILALEAGKYVNSIVVDLIEKYNNNEDLTAPNDEL